MVYSYLYDIIYNGKNTKEREEGDRERTQNYFGNDRGVCLTDIIHN